MYKGDFTTPNMLWKTCKASLMLSAPYEHCLKCQHRRHLDHLSYGSCLNNLEWELCRLRIGKGRLRQSWKLLRQCCGQGDLVLTW